MAVAYFVWSSQNLCHLFFTFHTIRWVHWPSKMYSEMGPSHHLTGCCFGSSAHYLPHRLLVDSLLDSLITPVCFQCSVLDGPFRDCMSHVDFSPDILHFTLRPESPITFIYYAWAFLGLPFGKALVQDLAGHTVFPAMTSVKLYTTT